MTQGHVTRVVGELTVTIDRGHCSAFKSCIDEAPSAFVMGDDDVVAFTATPETSSREQILAACRACPVAALTARDASGKQLAP